MFNSELEVLILALLLGFFQHSVESFPIDTGNEYEREMFVALPPTQSYASETNQAEATPGLLNGNPTILPTLQFSINKSMVLKKDDDALKANGDLVLIGNYFGEAEKSNYDEDNDASGDELLEIYEQVSSAYSDKYAPKLPVTDDDDLIETKKYDELAETLLTWGTCMKMIAQTSPKITTSDSNGKPQAMSNLTAMSEEVSECYFAFNQVRNLLKRAKEQQRLDNEVSRSPTEFFFVNDELSQGKLKISEPMYPKVEFTSKNVNLVNSVFPKKTVAQQRRPSNRVIDEFGHPFAANNAEIQANQNLFPIDSSLTGILPQENKVDESSHNINDNILILDVELQAAVEKVNDCSSENCESPTEVRLAKILAATVFALCLIITFMAGMLFENFRRIKRNKQNIFNSPISADNVGIKNDKKMPYKVLS